MPQHFPGRARLLLLAVLLEGGLVALACALGRLTEQPPLAAVRWSAADAGWGFVASLPLLAALFVCVRWPVGPLGRIKRVSVEMVAPLFEGCSLLELVVIALLAGAGEEALFRGVLQVLLSRWLGPWGGLAAASAVFGLLHPITLTYVLFAALMGGYLGWVWLTYPNLLIVIVAHAFYDFVALVYLARRAKPDLEPRGKPVG